MIVEGNRERYEAPGRRFEVLDLSADGITHLEQLALWRLSDPPTNGGA